jgi:hypothetical protein
LPTLILADDLCLKSLDGWLLAGTLPPEYGTWQQGYSTSLLLGDNDLAGAIPANWGQLKTNASAADGSGWDMVELQNNA